MGGTFDPIHFGHLRAAESVREAAGLDVVSFVPSGTPPHRTGPLSSALDRYAMVCLATQGHPGFLPSGVELLREGPSYTVDTIRGWKREKPDDEVVLIVGSDTFREMPGWHEAEALFSLCTVAVAERPDSVPLPLPKRTGVLPVEGAGLAISATDVRLRVREGRSIRYLVPDAVADYVTKRGLYR